MRQRAEQTDAGEPRVQTPRAGVDYHPEEQRRETELDEQEGDTVPLVIMTHTAPTGSFSEAVAEIDRLNCVTAPSLFLPVAD